MKLHSETQKTDACGSSVLSRLKQSAKSFAQSEDGSITNLAVATAIVMIAFGGLGIDMLHAEMKRAKIQAALDRSVLAAADLENVLHPPDVVYDYFSKMGVPNSVGNVQFTKRWNYKRVSAEANTAHDANFAAILGVDKFDIGGAAVAEERVNSIEVSLVLDISGSMAENNRMANMQAAAQVFVNTVIDDDYPNSVSVSLVPYSEHVALGPLYDRLTKTERHGFSRCLELPDDDMNTTALNTTRTWTQMQHYQWNYYGDNGMDNTVCPTQDWAQVMPMQRNKTALNTRISQLEPLAGTSIFMGMKWGVALLDSSTRSLISGINEVPAAFRDRPLDYGRDDVLKNVVLMTDGKHDKSFRLQNWAYASDSMIAHWNENNLWNFNITNVSDPWSWENFYTQRYSQGYGDALLDRICDAAKAQGIVIWTVAFETDSQGENVMRQCASSPGHFFDADGAELTDVFYSIANSINQLRLVQ